jgi:hypothetical protein
VASCCPIDLVVESVVLPLSIVPALAAFAEPPTYPAEAVELVGHHSMDFGWHSGSRELELDFVSVDGSRCKVSR